MDNFIVSARKYRPTTFQSVVGQQSLVTTLKNAILSNHLAHAYLFCGPRGVGKTTCARIFAKTINCQQLTPQGDACNVCESCVSYNDQRSFNIHELDAASNNGVDEIKYLIDQVRIPPQIGKYSVYIIDEVHMLSTNAFNAFLKTLEEPPAHAIFILATTEKHKIIPTILSRCQIYDFNRITVADTVAHLQYVADQEKVTVQPEALNVIAQKSDGGMRDALSIFDQVVSFCGNNITYKDVIENLNVLDYDYYFRLVTAFLQGDVPQAMMIFNEILNKGFDANHFVSGLSSHLRDVMVCKNPQTAALLEVGAAIGNSYKEQAALCELDFLYQALEIANECDLNYRLSKNKRLLVEIMLIRLCQLSDKKKNKLEATSPKIVLEKVFASTESPIVTTTSQITTAAQAVTTVQKPTEKPATIIPKSISIKNVKKEETQVVSTETFGAKRSTVFNQTQLQEAWKKFAQKIPDQITLVKTMEFNLPLLTAENVFEVHLQNSFQEKDLTTIKTQIMNYLAEELENDCLQMTFIIDQETEGRKIMMSKDKLDYLIEKNNAVTKLVAELGLEII